MIWKIGNQPSVVVSDTKVKNTNFPSPPNPIESEETDKEYYGGYLVCESIGNAEHAKLIAAAPELLDAALDLIYTHTYGSGKMIEGVRLKTMDEVVAAFKSVIKKATK